MVKIKDITQYLEQFAPLDHQESYDNCGLITGNDTWEVTGVLVSLDCTEAVVEEAISENCNLIIAHHPIWFRPIKKLSGHTYVERTIVKSIKHDVAIYAIHTNLDNIQQGVNHKLAEKLGLIKTQILAPKANTLMKLITFSPKKNTSEVLQALHQAGAGAIGNYEECAFIGSGTGTFKPNEQANPHIGQKNELEEVEEDRIEVIFEKTHKYKILEALVDSHPYEEIAYYFQELANTSQQIGAGMLGYLEEGINQQEFLQYIKERVGTPCLRHTSLLEKPIKKVAICGGAGSFLIKNAIKLDCDAFVTSDLKYHEFFDADNRLLVIDIGHYESEVSTKDLLSDLLNKKFSKFAVRLSKIDTNPIRYF